MSSSLTRREWTALFAASPLLSQSAAKPAPENTAPVPGKAVADVQKTSQRLAEIELPMNVEPAFRFAV